MPGVTATLSSCQQSGSMLSIPCRQPAGESLLLIRLHVAYIPECLCSTVLRVYGRAITGHAPNIENKLRLPECAFPEIQEVGTVLNNILLAAYCRSFPVWSGQTRSKRRYASAVVQKRCAGGLDISLFHASVTAFGAEPAAVDSIDETPVGQV